MWVWLDETPSFMLWFFWVITILSLQKSAALKFHSRYVLISRFQGKLKSFLNTCGFSVGAMAWNEVHSP